MSFTSLPPVLLSDILDKASGILPSRDWEQYKTRRANLRSYSLVHSKFRPIAQDLLPREIRRGGPVGEDFMNTIVGGLAQDAFKDTNVTHYQAGRTLMYLPGETVLLPIIKSWTNLVYLQIGFGARGARLDFANLRFFPHLESLRLQGCEMFVGTEDLVLPKLRHLVFTNLIMPRGNLEGYRRLFSPQTMPKLIHLALGFGESSVSTSQLFRDLGPQIKTLAVRCPDVEDDDLFMTIGRYMPNLEHLSLIFYPLDCFESHLFDHAAGLKLKTLHLGDRSLDKEVGLGPRLVKVARGEEETIQVEDIWIYGSRLCAKMETQTGLDMDWFNWVIQYSSKNKGNGLKGTPPFFQFDGSPEGRFGA